MSYRDQIVEVMTQHGCTELQTDRFSKRVGRFLAGEHGEIPESEIAPVDPLPSLADLEGRLELLDRLAVVKLNGGLGTSMGLSGPKGLLEIREGLDFYALTLKQLRALEASCGRRPPLLFMNSFRTESPTRERLRELDFEQDLPWGFRQSQVPKIDEQGRPVQGEGEYGWCPPGHGDLYSCLLDGGLKDLLLAAGKRYLFVSNIDNLGASVDPRPLTYLVERNAPFLMETTRRLPQDRKGGHLARSAQGGLLLREVAQCPEADLEAFQDVDRHRYFNTNNLWLDLEALDESWTELPLIVNRKPVRPEQPGSRRVVQLESAMGAVLGQLEGGLAVEVPRTRFRPLKTTDDLFCLRSDLYRLEDSGELFQRSEELPIVRLDPEQYRMIDGYRDLVKKEPSLLRCRSLKVEGRYRFRGDEELVGDVVLKGTS